MKAKRTQRNTAQAERMVVPQKINVEAYIDENDGIYVGARVSRTLHSRLMEEKAKSQDRVTLQEIVVNAIVSTYPPKN